jgi:hypothetical protein
MALADPIKQGAQLTLQKLTVILTEQNTGKCKKEQE